jgi:4-amino-4-deoxy-L-arabinose transferase-like glycosyltransferase
MLHAGVRKIWILAAVATLLVTFGAELFFSIRQESQTFDESAHIYAGYSYWKHADFGINPEHPPLVKLIATLPLLPLRLNVQPPPNIYFRGASAVGGIQFLYSQNADALLFRARIAASTFALALALLVFASGYEMFGAGTAFLALVLVVFEPNILAHGALVTTDTAVACCLFAAVYTFYRYVKGSSILRLVVCGIATGLALAAKHSGLLIFPTLVTLAAIEIVWRRPGPESDNHQKARAETQGRQTLRLLGALATITAISVTVLWAFYGFRYAARPGNMEITPPTAVFLESLHRPSEAGLIRFSERHHLLPESYLYGLTDVAILSHEGRPAFLLGRLYPQGRWFYFPAAFVIKSTLGFLLLLIFLIAAKGMLRAEVRRETLFLATPPVIFFSVAVASKLDIGLRHILPIYPFLIVLAAAGAWTLARQSRRWAYAVAVLFIFHVASSLRAYPNYLPYSNEIWGGPSNTYKVLADSNVGWEGGLKGVQKYLNSRQISRCWFAYDGPVDPDYYHIPCSPLPTLLSFVFRRRQDPVPEEIQGPVLLGSQELTGFDLGPEDMNAYAQFSKLRPEAVLQGEVLVFNGSFNVPKVSAESHFILANSLLNRGHPDQALLEAKTAAALYPDFIFAHEMLAALYAKGQQPEQALREYQTALHIYQTVHPEFQKSNPAPENPLSRH